MEQLVQESIDQALKLETALAWLPTPGTRALLPFSPIQAKVEGEPAQIRLRSAAAVAKSRLRVLRCKRSCMATPTTAAPRATPPAACDLQRGARAARAFPKQPPSKLLEFPRV